MLGKYQLSKKKFDEEKFYRCLTLRRAKSIFFTFDKCAQNPKALRKALRCYHNVVNFDWAGGRWVDIIVSKRKKTAPIYRATRIFGTIFIHQKKTLIYNVLNFLAEVLMHFYSKLIVEGKNGRR